MPKLEMMLIPRCVRTLVPACFVLVFGVAPIHAATQYTYDELNRLTKVVYDDGRSITYAYDAAGNLLSKQALGTPPPTGSASLPHTGIQSTQCYAAGSDVLASCTGSGALTLNAQQDGMRAGISPMSFGLVPHVSNVPGLNYSKNDCVRDNVTGLIWEGKTALNDFRDYRRTYTNLGDSSSGDASAYVAQVNAANLCGARNWRLPTADELQTIVNFGVTGSGAALDPDGFIFALTSPGYWTSSPLGRASQSMFVDFYTGDIGGVSKTSRLGVRLVRGSQTGAPAYETLANGSEVKDTRTGLIWRRCIEGATWNGTTCVNSGGTTFTHQAALQRATAQQTVDKAWRLPNAKELTSLVRRDRVEPQPFIDETFFPNTPTTYFWASTPVARTPGFAWTTFFGYGSTGSNQTRATAHPVRLVRSGVHFVDEFDGSALAPAAWVVTQAAASGRPATWAMANGALTVQVPGGSCGKCGVTDGSRFAPQLNAFGGDFEMVLSVAELSRTAVGGSRDHSGVRMYYGNLAWIGLLGNYSHVPLPDGTTVGHRVIGFGSNGAACFFDKSLGLNTLYAVELRIRRSGANAYMGYRLQNTTEWKESACTVPATGGSIIDVVSGDGGGTNSNGAVGLKLERYEVRAAAPH